MFFVNGQPPVNAVATFLYQSNYKGWIQFRVDKLVGCKLEIASVTIPTCLPVPFAKMGIDFGSTLYCQVHYTVCINNLYFYFGRIPYVSDSCSSPLRIGFLSCNDNPATAHVDNPYNDSSDTHLFTRLTEEQNDTVVHMGDNVYMDSVWERFCGGVIDAQQVATEAGRLYAKSFSEAEQGACMRQGYQLMMVDDHDYTDGSGGSITTKNPLFREYVDIVRRVHVNYGLSFGVRTYSLGKYRITLCDTRNALIDYGCRFHHTVISAVQTALGARDRSHIICLPTPLVNRNIIQAKFWELIYPADGFDESDTLGIGPPTNRYSGRRVATSN
jgi:hypothetical protein